MADVKMIATRESYGNTLKALAAEGHDDLVVLDADLAAATRPVCSARLTRTATLTAASPRPT